MIAIVDYNMGNVKSVYNAIQYLGFNPKITQSKRDIINATHVILPGVGAFPQAINALQSLDLIEVLNHEIPKNGKPFLGICLGMQMISTFSKEYSINEGLNWISGEVNKLNGDQYNLLIPHIGWNNIIIKKPCILFKHLPEEYLFFYFVHSYHFVCKNYANIMSTTIYGQEFVSSIQKDNIFAVQFHPEKSQENGLELLQNFLEWEA